MKKLKLRNFYPQLEWYFWSIILVGILNLALYSYYVNITIPKVVDRKYLNANSFADFMDFMALLIAPAGPAFCGAYIACYGYINRFKLYDSKGKINPTNIIIAAHISSLALSGVTFFIIGKLGR